MIRTIASIAIVLTSAVSACAQAVGGTNYRAITSLNAADGAMGFNGRFQFLENASFILVSDDPDQNLPIKAGRFDFFYPNDDSAEISRIVMAGNVEIDHPQGRVTSGHAEFDFAKGVAEFTENPVMHNENAPEGFFAERIELDLEKQELRFRGGRAPILNFSNQIGGGGGGNAALRDSDVTDWPALVGQLKNQQTPPARHILTLIDPATKQAISSNTVEIILTQKDQILKLLNSLLTKRAFYNADAWAGIAINPAAAQIFATDEGKLTEQQRAWVNRAALHAAFPGAVNPPPAQP